VKKVKTWKQVFQVNQELLGLLASEVNPVNQVGPSLFASPDSQVKKAKTRKPASQVNPVLLATLESPGKGIR
jgi:hypothetical protein